MVKPDSNRNSGNLGFEAELFKAADKLRGNMEPKDYARPALNKVMLGELIDLISGIALGEEGSRSKDVLAMCMNTSSASSPAPKAKSGAQPDETCPQLR
jgi:hypothetical protein